MDLEYWAETDVGRKRSENEDRFFCSERHGVFAVADGVGGKPGGCDAAQTVVDGIEEHAEEFRRFVDDKTAPLDRDDRDEIFEYLVETLQQINEDVYHRGLRDQYPRGIGCTVDLVVLASQGAFVLHVGDSRVYLLHDDEIFRITRDHTYEEYLLAHPELAEDDVPPETYSNVLTRSMGAEPRVEIDRVFVDVKPGDRIVMCTDGLTDYLTGAEIAELSAARPNGELPTELVDSANRRGGKDNVTAVVVATSGESQGEFGPQDTRPDTFQRIRFLESVDLFSKLELQELLTVLRYVQVEEFDAGATIVSKGTVVDGLYFVMEGLLSVEVGGEELTKVGPGDHFGEFAMFGQPVRSADVRCRRDCELLFMPERDLRQLVREEPVLGNKLLWKLLARTSELIQGMMNDEG